MKLHGNHRTCPNSRRLICRRVLEEGGTPRQAAEAAGCSVCTAAKWGLRLKLSERAALTGDVRRIGIPPSQRRTLIRALQARPEWIRLATSRLLPGRYLIMVCAEDAVGSLSSPRRTSFAVKRRAMSG
jgi:hypothetical protein